MNRPNQSSHPRSRLRLLTCGYAMAAALIGTAHADDSEIYISKSSTPPNIMLILDTSGSMSGAVTSQDPYNEKTDYIAMATGSCASIRNQVFFKTERQGTPPGCASEDKFSLNNLLCAKGTAAIASSSGSYSGDRFTQWRPKDEQSTRRSWRTLDGDFDAPVDCQNDGDYPDVNGTGNTDTPDYTNNANDSYWRTKTGTSATLYSANYVAYYAQFRNAVTSTRLKVMQQAATNLLNGVSNVNVGLMRYSSNTSNATGGGMVIAPVAPIDQNRADLIAKINAFVADGNTPLSETLYEAHQYFTGGSVVYGNTSRGCFTRNGSTVCESIPSVPGSRTDGQAGSNTYASPIAQACQKNYIVYLTDGEPTSDSQSDSAIKALPGFSSLVPLGCNGDSNGDGTPDANGSCLGALSEYMFDRDLRQSLDGTQNLTSYYIGFGDAFGSGTSNAAFAYLEDAGARAGGDAYQAGDLSDLTQVFTDIFNSISKTSSSLTAPTVAVNAFNRTRTLDDLYISVFQPAAGLHWPGNIKKYRAVGDDDTDVTTIRARGDVVAVGTNGLFLDSTSDYWSRTDSDGSKVELGGAARKIPSPTARNVYTYIGNNIAPRGGAALAGSVQTSVHVDNTLLTDTILGTTTTGNPLRAKLINWARGMDVDDENDNDNSEEARLAMGDPMHSQPAVLIYGGRPGNAEDRDADDAVVFTATNDGYLHAFATETGEEQWAFIPQEMLPNLKPLYENENSPEKNYLIDGDLRLLKYDTNGDGIVDPAANDRVLLFFSTGRNPNLSRYYALDVTRKNAPKFLWSIGPDQLDNLGQAWSRPTIARVNIRGATQNSQKMVLIFGGGYDPLEEGGAYVAETEVGNRIYMVDAVYGTVLWTAGDDGTNLELERMTHSIPAGITVVDFDGDTFADRMYAADMGAQVWRFDIYNSRTADELVTGGVMASLGAKDAGTVNAANTRRFYNEPDVALLQLDAGLPFYNIAIGSGYRGHPLSTSNQDRFYSIRDLEPFTKRTQAQYAAFDILTDDELYDVTDVLAPLPENVGRGWKLQLNLPRYQGEKVLSASTTLNNVLLFTTYTPSTESNTCSVALGTNYAYAISAFDGSPLPVLEDPTRPPGPTNPYVPRSRGQRGGNIGGDGISRGITTLFPEGADKNKVVCLSGVKVLDICKDFNSRVKTYWQQTDAN